ncbi:secretin and TonB N-terminal domain-containing protein, partial [Chitinophaga sp.]|uniref:secretin and TonB N-terminal domain-containing protein n=1 Tax=Chitinophaga sp. TaxID=1869181 RepID=UPI002F91DA23
MKEKILHGCMWFLLIVALPAMAQTNVLQQKVSISFRNEGITKCFSQLQAKGGVTFFYNPADIKVLDKKYNADLNNKTVAEVLGYLLLNTGLEYEAVDGKKVVIRKIIIKQSTAPRKRTISGIVIDATKNNPVAHAEIMAQSTGSVVTADEAGRFYIDVKDTTDVLVVY